MFTVIAGAILGGLLTIISGSQPGALLGGFVVVATAVAVFAVAPRAAYMVIPVPSLAYVVIAVAAGLITDSALDTSRAAFAISAIQWIASGFLAMIAATALAIAASAGRWLAAERAASRRRPRPGSATATPAAQQSRGGPPTSPGPGG